MSRSVFVKMTAVDEPAFECSSCGAPAACDCDAPRIPRDKAAAALLANPHKSNRAIAADIGVSEPTVRRVRQATASADAVEKRIGRDGKARRQPRERVEPEVESVSPKMQRKLEVHGWYQRAELAAQEARYAPVKTCPTDAKMKRLAADVIKAWTAILKHIGEDNG